MNYDEDNLHPLYIEAGEVLTPRTISGARYSFEHIQFSGIPVVQYPDGTDLSDINEVKTFFPKEADSMICFTKVKDLVSGFFDEVKNYAKITNEEDTLRPKVTTEEVFVDMKEAGEKNSGFISPNGTLIPQIIYPWDFGRNDLKMFIVDPYDYETDDAQLLAEEAELNDASVKKYYLWTPIQPEIYEDNSYMFNAVNTLKNYGVRYDVGETKRADYISILGKNKVMDENSFIRKFYTNFPEVGVFALLLDFTSYDKDETGKNPCEAIFKFYISELSKHNFNYLPDYIEFRASPDGDVVVKINKDSVASGTLSFNNLGQKILQVKSEDLKGRNVIFFYPLMNSLLVTGDLVTDPTQSSKYIICKKHQDLNILNETQPALNAFPAKHKKGGTNCVQLRSKDIYVNIGDRVEATFKNCCANFAFVPLRFCPVVEFSYFYRMSGEQTSTNDGLNGMRDYFCLEIGGKNTNYIGLKNTYTSRKIYYDADTQTSVFRVDFRFHTGLIYGKVSHYDNLGIKVLPKGTLQVNAFEIFGLIHITKLTGSMTQVLNEDGDFERDFSSNIVSSILPGYIGVSPTDTDLMRFVTNVNISHGFDGTTGSMTLDKYLMMDLSKNPEQAIGALTLNARNSFYSGNSGFNPNGQYTAPVGQIFKGYAMEIQDQISEGNSQLTVKLVGIQKKLEDMKLVNCPFWDGDQVFENGADGVLNYMISYSGCNLRYVPAFSNGAGEVSSIILPRSWDWQAPSTNFVLGTPVLDALKEIAKKINHQFVIQPDGCGYFYYMDQYGCPTWVKNGGIVKTYHESEIISMDITPYLENKYNTFLTLGMLVKNNSNKGDIVPDGEKPGMKFTQSRIGTGDYPWSRIITNSEPGLVTIKELEKFHRTNVRFGKSSIFTGSITVPGWYGFYLFDKIRINSDTTSSMTFYITGITHNINLQTKEWITNLSVAQFDV